MIGPESWTDCAFDWKRTMLQKEQNFLIHSETEEVAPKSKGPPTNELEKALERHDLDLDDPLQAETSEPHRWMRSI